MLKEPDLKRRLRLFFNSYRDYSRSHPEHFTLLLYMASHPEVFAELSEEVQRDIIARRAELVNRMIELVDAMKAQGCLKDVDSTTYVIALISTANGLLQSRSRSLYSQYGVDMDRVDDLIMGRLIDSVCN